MLKNITSISFDFQQMNSRDLKADISEEKLSHKIREVMDANYDRYNRRLTYTEERLELVFKKLEVCK